MARKPRIKTELKKHARKLFYVQGYPNTGISQIIESAGTNKATFYYNYRSKEQLGREYLHEYSDYLLIRLARQMKRSASPEDFIRRWVTLVKKDVTLHDDTFNGCPLGNFINQIDIRGTEFAPFIGELVKNWEAQLSRFFAEMQASDRFPKDLDPTAAAARCLAIYHGCMVLWKATRELNYIEQAEEMMIRCVAR